MSTHPSKFESMRSFDGIFTDDKVTASVVEENSEDLIVDEDIL